MREPALILSAELPWSVDTAHAQHDGAQAEYPCVVVHILVGRPFRATVRAVEIQRGRFADAMRQPLHHWTVAAGAASDLAATSQPTVDLVGRRKDQRRQWIFMTQTFEQVERPKRV